MGYNPYIGSKGIYGKIFIMVCYVYFDPNLSDLYFLAFILTKCMHKISPKVKPLLAKHDSMQENSDAFYLNRETGDLGDKLQLGRISNTKSSMVVMHVEIAV